MSQNLHRILWIFDCIHLDSMILTTHSDNRMGILAALVFPYSIIFAGIFSLRLVFDILSNISVIRLV